MLPSSHEGTSRHNLQVHISSKEIHEMSLTINRGIMKYLLNKMARRLKNVAEDNSKRKRTIMPPNAAIKVVLRHVGDMNKNGKRGQSSSSLYGVDDIDMGVIQYMVEGYSNADIADKMDKPLSTIQRRSRRLVDRGIIVPYAYLNYSKFGLRRGLLQFKCKSANLQQAVEKIAAIDGIERASAYLGSIDVIANVVYADSKEVLKTIAEVQKLDLITDVSWSEEIHSLPI